MTLVLCIKKYEVKSKNAPFPMFKDLKRKYFTKTEIDN